MKKILMTGCGGMLGEAFYHHFKEKFNIYCSDIDLNEEWLNFLDFRDYEKYFQIVKSFSPDYIFHLGAHTDLEYCEKNPDDTYLTNYFSVENATIIANKFDIPLVFISTAGVFDGKKDVYDDWDIPNPLGHYARSKFLSEIYIQQNSKKYLILRAGWMIGGGQKKDKKFVNKIIQQIIEGKKELYVVNDKFGTPTYTKDFAKNVDILLNSKFWGLYNLVCEGESGRLEIANEIVKLLNYQDTVKIIEVDSNYFSKDYFVKRPKSEKLINKKLNLRKLNFMRSWKVCLNEYIKNNFSEFIKK